MSLVAKQLGSDVSVRPSTSAEVNGGRGTKGGDYVREGKDMRFTLRLS